MIPHRWLWLVTAITLAAGPVAAQAPLLGLVRRMLPAEARSAREVLLFDADGDGDLDALVANQGGLDDRTTLLVNDGSGGFTDGSAALPAEAAAATEELAVGDVDGDGFQDVVQVTVLGPTLNLWSGDGSGGFTTTLTLAVPGRRFALVDVDGDQDLDLLGADGLFLWSGAAGFVDASASLPALPLPPGPPPALATGDVDGDGDVDLYVGIDTTLSQQSTDRLYLNDGSGTFTDASTRLPATSLRTRGAILADLDGDGDLDLAAATRRGGPGTRNPLWLNDGTGTFADASLQLPDPSGVDGAGIAAVDVDGDGDPDLVVANDAAAAPATPSGAPNRILLNDGAAQFTEAGGALAPDRRRSVAVAAGDVDGDGDADLLFGNAGLGQDSLHLNDGHGSFLDVTGDPVAPDDGDDLAAAVGDVDGDGDADVVVGSRILLNDGVGRLAPGPHPLPATGGVIEDLELIDMNGDGHLDLVAAVTAVTGVALGHQNAFWLNVGGGSFIDGTSLLPPAVDQTSAVASGDLDGNGLPDLLFGNRQPCAGPFGCTPASSVAVLNLGTGTLAAPLPASLDETMDVALGDVDGDGDLDVLLGNRSNPVIFSGDARNRLLLNDGAGSFTPSLGLPVQLDDTNAVLLVDVDGDGDLDAVCGNADVLGNPQPDRLLLNDGTGTFTDASSNLPASPTATRDLVAADLDADGDLDLYGATEGQDFLWLNDGTGHFLDASATLPPEVARTAACVAGDLLGNHLPDLFLVNLTRDRLYANLGATATWRGLPRFGQQIAIDVRGPAGAPWLLFGSPLSTAVPAPPFGTLSLDLTILYDLGGGTLDSTGRATFSYPFPPNPGGLSGLTVHVQALVLTATPRLSNRQPLTFLDF